MASLLIPFYQKYNFTNIDYSPKSSRYRLSIVSRVFIEVPDSGGWRREVGGGWDGG